MPLRMGNVGHEVAAGWEGYKGHCSSGLPASVYGKSTVCAWAQSIDLLRVRARGIWLPSMFSLLLES